MKTSIAFAATAMAGKPVATATSISIKLNFDIQN